MGNHCSDCDFVAAQQSSPKPHNEAKHNGSLDETRQKHSSEVQLFSCDYCDKNFQTEIRWKKHVLSHTKLAMQQKGSSKKCIMCSEEFLSAKDLQRHSKEVHGLKTERKYDCDICGRSYSNASGK